MPSSDTAPGLAAVSQAFGLTIQDPAAPSKVNGDASITNGTNGTKAHERYVNLLSYTINESVHNLYKCRDEMYFLLISKLWHILQARR
jgi:hypothetical protein